MLNTNRGICISTVAITLKVNNPRAAFGWKGLRPLFDFEYSCTFLWARIASRALSSESCGSVGGSGMPEVLKCDDFVMFLVLVLVVDFYGKAKLRFSMG